MMATTKQELVAKKILANPSKPLGEAMLEVGYSPNSATAPGKNLTSSDGWKELMDKYLPDDRLLDVHDKLLDSKQEQIRLGAVSLGYKVKGKLQPENVNQVNVGEMNVQFREKEKDDI